jgi:hypothetical protein
MSTQPHTPTGQLGAWVQAAMLAVVMVSFFAIIATILILMVLL